jgi:hypothetical protein
MFVAVSLVVWMLVASAAVVGCVLTYGKDWQIFMGLVSTTLMSLYPISVHVERVATGKGSLFAPGAVSTTVGLAIVTVGVMGLVLTAAVGNAETRYGLNFIALSMFLMVVAVIINEWIWGECGVGSAGGSV